MVRWSRTASCAAVLTVLLSAALGFGIASGSTAVQRLAANKYQDKSHLRLAAPVNPSSQEPLLVSLLDGSVVALDGESGETLWSFDSGLPLVGASGPLSSPAGSGHDPGSGTNREDPSEPTPGSASRGEGRGSGTAVAAAGLPSIFPGADGALYMYRRGDVLQRGLEKLPITVPELVDGAPSVTEDGSYVVGSRHTTLYVLDAATGELLKAFLEFGGHLAEVDNLMGLPEEEREKLDLEGTVVLGRHDYTIRSVDAATGHERWNVTYAKVQRLQGPASSAPPPGPYEGLTLGPENSLHLTDTATGRPLWSVAFPTPVASAQSPDGHDALAAPAAADAGRVLAGDSSDGGATFGGRGKQAVLVGQLAGGLYALPAQHWLATLPAPASWASKAKKHTRLEELVVQDGALVALGVEPATGTDADWTCPPGIHAVADAADETHSFLPIYLRPGVQQLALGPSPAAGSRCLTQYLSIGPPGEWTWSLLAAVLLVGALGGGIAVALGQLCMGFRNPKLRTQTATDGAGVTTMTMDYTGTVDDMESARAAGAASLVDPQPAETAKKELRELRRRKHSRYSRLSNRVNGTLASAAAGAAAPPGKPRETSHAADAEDGDEEPLSDHASDGGGKGLANGRTVPVVGRRRSAAAYGSIAADAFGSEDFRQSSERRRHRVAPEEAAGGSEAANGGAGGGPDAGLVKSGVGFRPAPVRERQKVAEGVSRVGRLEIGPAILGYGSSGTLVFEGGLDGRPVAVKRILIQYYEVARKEIAAYIVSDEHPNVVRCFAMEEDAQFVYLALERCRLSLHDAVQSPATRERLSSSRHASTSAAAADDAEAPWEPSELCMQIAQDVGRGLAALHERGIVHRDLKPHNVLLTDGWRGKVSDMGLCKRLAIEQSSFESAGMGGSSGWQAPEQLVTRSGGEARQGRSVDVFSFGLVLFYCLTGGRHAFGESYERDINILQGRPDLKPLAHLPEAENLVRAMLAKSSKKRPSIGAVMAHPMWWSPAKRLAFLIALSDRMELEDRADSSALLQALENAAFAAVGHDWRSRLDADLVANLGQYRKYNTASLRDLLRVIRNKHNHFRELPPSLQAALSPLPDAFLRYFTSRFPHLLLVCYSFARNACADDSTLGPQFFGPAAESFDFLPGASHAPPAAQPQTDPPHPSAPQPPAVHLAPLAAAAEERPSQAAAQPAAGPSPQRRSHDQPGWEPPPPQQQQQPWPPRASALVPVQEDARAQSAPGALETPDPLQLAAIAEGRDESAASDASPILAPGLPKRLSRSDPGLGSPAGSSSGLGEGKTDPRVWATSSQELTDLDSLPSTSTASLPFPAEADAAAACDHAVPELPPSRGRDEAGGAAEIAGAALPAGPPHARPRQPAVSYAAAVQPPPPSPPPMPQKPQPSGGHLPTGTAAAPPAPPQQRAPEAVPVGADAPVEARDSELALQQRLGAAAVGGQGPGGDGSWGGGQWEASRYGSGATSGSGSSLFGNPLEDPIFTGPIGRASDPRKPSAGLPPSSSGFGLFPTAAGPHFPLGPPGQLQRSPQQHPAFSSGFVAHPQGPYDIPQGPYAIPQPPPPPGYGPMQHARLSSGGSSGGDSSSFLGGDGGYVPLGGIRHPLGAGFVVLAAGQAAAHSPGGGMPPQQLHGRPLGLQNHAGPPATSSPPQPSQLQNHLPQLQNHLAQLQNHSHSHHQQQQQQQLQRHQAGAVGNGSSAAGSGGGKPDGGKQERAADEDPEVGTIIVFPHRPGQLLCDFYAKTGHCKYGESCKFDHPPSYAVRLNRDGLPIRPGEPPCSFYERTKFCKFGPSCKFDHSVKHVGDAFAKGSPERPEQGS